VTFVTAHIHKKCICWQTLSVILSLFFEGFEVKYVVVPQVYTIIAFGASIFLWLFLPTVVIDPSMEGIPLYSIHPLFTLEFYLLLSTAIVWFIAFLFSLYNMRKQTMTLTEIVGRNLFMISLVLITIIVALSGCVLYSELIHFEEFPAMDLPPLPPPNPFGVLHGYGILLCEPAWIITVLSKYL